MLARTLGPKFNQFPCFGQPKLNGDRALAQAGVFQSRGEKLWKPHFFPHIAEQIHSLGLDKLILDGEFYVHGWRLQRINQAIGVNNNNPNEDTPFIEFHVFDVVDPHRSFSSRFFDVYTPIQQANLSHVKVVPTVMITSRADLDLHFHQYTSQGYEGIMLRPDGPYEFGEHWSDRSNKMTEYRSRTLWKHKQWEDGEFVCIGTTQGEGKADIGVGALICTTNPTITLIWNNRTGEGDYVFKVGTGFTDEERIEFAKNPPIGKLIKVRYLNLTADGIPFNPSFLCILS